MAFQLSGSGEGSGKGELHVDYDTLGKIMKSAPVRKVVNEAAHEIAANLAGQPGIGHVYVDAYTTDRAAAAVVIPDYTRDRELKYGQLSRAALAAGLEVKPK